MKRFRLFSEAEARVIASRLTDWKPGASVVAGSIKRNDETFDDDLSKTVSDAISRNKELLAHTMLCRMSAPKFSRYTEGQEYGRHFDSPFMNAYEMRTDFALTLFLNDGYEGGYLVVDGNAQRGLPGEALVYPCGAEHCVTPVTSGARIAAVCWIRSLIRDEKQRAILTELSDVLQGWDSPQKYGLEYTTLTGIQAALLRMWMEA